MGDVLDANCVSVANIKRILKRAADPLMLLERIFSANPPETSNSCWLLGGFQSAGLRDCEDSSCTMYIDGSSCTMYINQCVSSVYISRSASLLEGLHLNAPCIPGVQVRDSFLKAGS